MNLKGFCLGAAVPAVLRKETLDDLAANAAATRWPAIAQDRGFPPCLNWDLLREIGAGAALFPLVPDKPDQVAAAGCAALEQ